MATIDLQKNKNSRYSRDGQVKDPYECKTEVRRLYDEYNKFPLKLQKGFPFIDYMDFQLELQNKI